MTISVKNSRTLAALGPMSDFRVRPLFELCLCARVYDCVIVCFIVFVRASVRAHVCFWFSIYLFFVCNFFTFIWSRHTHVNVFLHALRMHMWLNRGHDIYQTGDELHVQLIRETCVRTCTGLSGNTFEIHHVYVHALDFFLKHVRQVAHGQCRPGTPWMLNSNHRYRQARTALIMNIYYEIMKN
jgi:hypothetical protein